MSATAQDTAAAAGPVDVAILGGGMVGASLAVALAPLGLNIAVVEARRPGAPGQPSYDDRATAISTGSQRILETMGVWQSLAEAATPIHRIHVSDRGRFGATRLNCAEEGVPALGYVVENRELGRILWKRLESADTISLVCPATLSGIETRGDAVHVSCLTGESELSLEASLVVAADGAHSRARSLAGIESSEQPYEQTAVITNVTTRERHGNTAYERFTSEGPLAFLPMSNGRSSVVWTLATEHAGQVMALNDADFLDELQHCFGYRLGRLLKTGRRHAYPLSLVRSTTLVGKRIALAGNAAHGLHPVAGQGLNLGLRDVAALADVIADVVHEVPGLTGCADVGADVVLRRYDDWRAEDQRNIVNLTDGLVRAFTNPFAPVRAARGLALIALDALPGARRGFARRTMGLEGRLPRLARGVALA